MNKYSSDNEHNGYASTGEPLYTKEDFIYYFENRLQHIIRDEVNAQFHQAFYGLPF